MTDSRGYHSHSKEILLPLSSSASKVYVDNSTGFSLDLYNKQINQAVANAINSSISEAIEETCDTLEDGLREFITFLPKTVSHDPYLKEAIAMYCASDLMDNIEHLISQYNSVVKLYVMLDDSIPKDEKEKQIEVLSDKKENHHIKYGANEYGMYVSWVSPMQDFYDTYANSGNSILKTLLAQWKRDPVIFSFIREAVDRVSANSIFDMGGRWAEAQLYYGRHIKYNTTFAINEQAVNEWLSRRSSATTIKSAKGSRMASFQSFFGTSDGEVRSYDLSSSTQYVRSRFNGRPKALTYKERTEPKSKVKKFASISARPRYRVKYMDETDESTATKYVDLNSIYINRLNTRPKRISKIPNKLANRKSIKIEKTIVNSSRFTKEIKPHSFGPYIVQNKQKQTKKVPMTEVSKVNDVRFCRAAYRHGDYSTYTANRISPKTPHVAPQTLEAARLKYPNEDVKFDKHRKVTTLLPMGPHKPKQDWVKPDMPLKLTELSWEDRASAKEARQKWIKSLESNYDDEFAPREKSAEDIRLDIITREIEASSRYAQAHYMDYDEPTAFDESKYVTYDSFLPAAMYEAVRKLNNKSVIKYKEKKFRAHSRPKDSYGVDSRPQIYLTRDWSEPSTSRVEIKKIKMRLEQLDERMTRMEELMDASPHYAKMFSSTYNKLYEETTRLAKMLQ